MRDWCADVRAAGFAAQHQTGQACLAENGIQSEGVAAQVARPGEPRHIAGHAETQTHITGLVAGAAYQCVCQSRELDSVARRLDQRQLMRRPGELARRAPQPGLVVAGDGLYITGDRAQQGLQAVDAERQRFRQPADAHVESNAGAVDLAGNCQINGFDVQRLTSEPLNVSLGSRCISV